MVKSHLFRAGALLVPALAAACGTGTAVRQGAPPPATPRAAVLASMQQVQATSYRFTMQLTMTGFGPAMGSEGSAYSFGERGAYSAGQRALEATVTIPLPKSSSGGHPIREVVFLRTGTAYVSTAAGRWYELTGANGGFGSLLGSLNGESPSGYVGTMSAAVTGASRVGTATVDGVTTTEYAVTENLRTVLDKLLSGGFAGQIAKSFGVGSAAAGRSFSQGLAAALKAMPPDITFHVYLDSAGHLRRFTLSLPVGPVFTAVFSGLGLESAETTLLKSAFEHVQEQVTMDLSGWGVPVRVTPPPASEVTKGVPPGASASGSAAASGSASAVAGMTGSAP